MDLGLAGKTALVAGGSVGIGRSIAETLAGEGCRVVICGRDRQRLATAAGELAGRGLRGDVHTVVADAQAADEARRAVLETVRDFGRIDILINNSEGPPFDDIGPEGIADADWRLAFEGKLLGYARLMGLVLPGMQEHRWGRIINVIGLAGREPSAQLIKAGVVNAALMNLTKSTARIAARHGVLVTAVNPGFIRTPRSERFRETYSRQRGLALGEVEQEIAGRIPLGRFGTAEEVAHLVAFLASERASYITGATIAIDGGFAAGV